MKKKLFVLTITLLILVLGYWKFGTHKIPQKNNQDHINSKHQDSTSENIKNTDDKTDQEMKALITPEDLKSLRMAMPEISQIRLEAGKYPHRTPESLVSFATKLGPLYQKALTNPQDAFILATELQDCALRDHIAQAARALCASRVRKLATIWPQLNDIAKRTQSELPLDIKKSTKKIESLQK